MNSRNTCTAAAGVLFLAGAVILIAAAFDPLFLPHWPKWLLGTLAALYAGYTALLFVMPRLGEPDLGACVSAALDFLALGVFALCIHEHLVGIDGRDHVLLGLVLVVVSFYAGPSIRKWRGVQA